MPFTQKERQDRYRKRRRSEIADRRRKKSEVFYRWLAAFKKNKPCADCKGLFSTVCMDFDHRDPHEKKANISRMYQNTMEQILDEIAKCDLVCSNCHRIRTAHLKGWNLD